MFLRVCVCVVGGVGLIPSSVTSTRIVAKPATLLVNHMK